MSAKRERIEIPGDWQGRDRFLYALARQTGFMTINRLLAHVAYELAGIKTPARFYRALSKFHDEKSSRKKR